MIFWIGNTECIFVLTLCFTHIPTSGGVVGMEILRELKNNQTSNRQDMRFREKLLSENVMCCGGGNASFARGKNPWVAPSSWGLGRKNASVIE